MTLPKIASHDEWAAARQELLLAEKELTRARDRLSTRRRELPMVEITKDYELDGSKGPASLLDLFEGRRQLIMYHFMFDPSWDDGCPSCTAGTDEMSPGLLEHLHTRDTSYAMVSRAPLAKLEAWKAKRGWDLAWYSSFGTDFNDDFGVTVDGDEIPGRTCFLRVDDRVFMTYQQFARGLESTGGSYYFLDLTALGRQEDWEEPKGRSDEVRTNQPDFAS
jgi:predicted dithiol-disulfide oxidoreductase (DUF899 family)